MFFIYLMLYVVQVPARKLQRLCLAFAGRHWRRLLPWPGLVAPEPLPSATVWLAAALQGGGQGGGFLEKFF